MARAASAATNGGGFWGVGGVAIGAMERSTPRETGQWTCLRIRVNTLLAKTPGELKVKQYFTPANLPSTPPKMSG
jgi:hypothetical protein